MAVSAWCASTQKTKVIHLLEEIQPAVAEEGVSVTEARQVTTSRGNGHDQNTRLSDLLNLSVSGPAEALIHQFCRQSVSSGIGRGAFLALQSAYESKSRARLMDLNDSSQGFHSTAQGKALIIFCCY